MRKLRWIGIGLFGIAQSAALSAHAQAAATPPSIAGIIGSVNTLLVQIPLGAATLGNTSLATYNLRQIPVISTLQVTDGIAVLQAITDFQQPITSAFTPNLAGLSGLTTFSP